MISSLDDAPSAAAEDLLFQLAESDPRLYPNHAWRDAAVRRGTASAAKRLIDLVVKGALQGRSPDGRYMIQQIGQLINSESEVRTYAYGRLEEGLTSPGIAGVAAAIA